MWDKASRRIAFAEPGAQSVLQMIESFRGQHGDDPLVEESLLRIS
jgi:hypothetical protein